MGLNILLGWSLCLDICKYRLCLLIESLQDSPVAGSRDVAPEGPDRTEPGIVSVKTASLGNPGCIA